MMTMRSARTLCAAVMMICVAVCTSSADDKWETMRFSENISADLDILNEYCDMHDISVEDVMWANNCDAIEPGTELIMPQTRADLLAIWQKSGAWQRKGLHDKEAFKASREMLELPPLRSSREELAAQQTDAPAPELDKPAAQTPPAVSAFPSAQPSPAPAVTEHQPAAAQAPSVSEVSVKKSGEDPIIMIKPDGDRMSGPMRLIISGDEVEVVKLPADPKKKASREELDKLLPVPFLTHEELHDRKDDLKGAKMIWPVNGIISSPYGQRGNRHHDGLDIPMPPGTPIRAARAGTVEVTGTNTTPGFRGYGNFALVNHGNNMKTLYAHCQKVNVKPGQRVRQGQEIALVGRSGRASTDHLHFEIRIGGKAVNPIKYLPNKTNKK